MKLTLKIIGAVAGVIILVVAALAAYLFATALRPSKPVAFQQVAVHEHGHTPLAVDVWYHTAAKPGLVLPGSTALRVASQGPDRGTALPTVVISHGTVGEGTRYVDTARARARSG